ncbi:hypothetical protein Tco_0770000 [Tanacetum coccineum]|uniref:Uncharacterized protein n=1 Tax=Tanacetum coccineum TaxID=301880 RepID=A0ABQ4ZAZ3_9ASTR
MFQNEVNDIRSERLARSANPLALLAAAQPYSDNYYQAPKPQRSNAPSYMQSSSTRPSASEGYSEKKKKLGTDTQCKVLQKGVKTTNTNLRTSSNSRNKTEDTTPRYNNDNQSGQFGNQRTMTVAWGPPFKETVDQNAAECVDERVALANLTLDTEENKTGSRGRATSSRDSSLIALQTKQTELEKYTTLNDLTSDYKILQTKLNETLGLLALKDIDKKEGLKTKTYEISAIQSIQTIYMLAPKIATYNGRSTFANPKYLKKAQSEKLSFSIDTHMIPPYSPDPANRFCPNGRRTVTS